MPESTTGSVTDSKQLVKKHIEWTSDHEKILVEWADKAMCYRWMHAKANTMYTKLNIMFTIPVIIISTLTGTANFAQDRVPPSFQSIFVMVVGGFNLLAGIISTIQQFLKITQTNEAHRVSTISWDKFYRNIKIELAKHPNERIPVGQMIKMSKEEFDRLMETSPVIPEEILKLFKTEFSKPTNSTDKEVEYPVMKPEICDSLVSTYHIVNKWNSVEGIEHSIEHYDKELETKFADEKIKHDNILQMISIFKENFIKTHNRPPMRNEIVDNLKQHIEEEVLQRMVKEQDKSNSGNDNNV